MSKNTLEIHVNCGAQSYVAVFPLEDGPFLPNALEAFTTALKVAGFTYVAGIAAINSDGETCSSSDEV